MASDEVPIITCNVYTGVDRARLAHPLLMSILSETTHYSRLGLAHSQ